MPVSPIGTYSSSITWWKKICGRRIGKSFERKFVHKTQPRPAFGGSHALLPSRIAFGFCQFLIGRKWRKIIGTIQILSGNILFCSLVPWNRKKIGSKPEARDGTYGMVVSSQAQPSAAITGNQDPMQAKYGALVLRWHHRHSVVAVFGWSGFRTWRPRLGTGLDLPCFGWRFALSGICLEKLFVYRKSMPEYPSSGIQNLSNQCLASFIDQRVSGNDHCVPEGNYGDLTRLPEIYDGTYKYLKSTGIPVL